MTGVIRGDGVISVSAGGEIGGRSGESPRGAIEGARADECISGGLETGGAVGFTIEMDGTDGAVGFRDIVGREGNGRAAGDGVGRGGEGADGGSGGSGDSTDEIGDQGVCDGSAAASNEIVARGGGVAVVACGDVVKIGSGGGIDVGKSLGAGEGRLTGERAALIRDGDKGGPHGSSEAGAADLNPGSVGRIVGIDDGDAGVGIGEHGDIGNSPRGC